MLVAADRIVRAHDRRIVQVMASYADSLRRIAIANSEGRYVEDVQPQVVFYVSAVASDRGIIQTGRQPIGGAMGFELFDIEDPEAAALKAAKQATLMLDAAPAPTGRMPVVISSQAGGTMVHEAVGHGLEADHIDKQISKYCGRLGEMIAAPEVSVVDDGTLPSKRGSFNVDDEGTPARRAVLVDKGRLVAFMNDLRTCRKMKLEPTGNGRRQSYAYKPVPRMRNTMIAPGNADPAEILASTPRGLYVTTMGGGQVNTLNGEFVFEVSEGYLIENGKIGKAVRGATLIGNGPDVLMNIDAVGSDLGFAIGTCGKEGQWVPISDAQPTIRIKELTIGGTA
jgi:TldD protein